MKRQLLRLSLWALAAAVLGFAFAAYLQPEFMLDLANRVYLCF